MPRAKVDSPSQPVININTQAAVGDLPDPTPPPKEERDPRWFIDEIHGLPLQEWGRVWSMELHRLEPKIPGVPGSKGYLCMYLEPITYSAIQNRYGGGKFRLNLCKNGKWHKSHDFDIEGQPIYDTSRERPNANGNGTAVATGVGGDVLKVLEQQNERLYQVLTTLQGAKDDNPAISASVDMLTSAYKTGLSAVATQPGGSDPTKQLDGVLAIAERIVSVRGGGGGGLNEAITLLKELGVFQKPKTLKEQLEELKAMGDLISGGSGVTESGIKNPWLIGLKMLEPHLPEILETFKTTSTNTIAAAQERAARARAAAAQQPAPANRALPPVPAIRPQPPERPVAPAPAIHVTGGLNVVPREADNHADQHEPAIEAETPSMVAEPIKGEWSQEKQDQFDTAMKINMVNMMRTGASGGAIASYVEDCKPEMAKDFTKYPSDVITEFFLQDPVLKHMVEDPRWEEVLADAKDFLTEEVVN